MILDIISLLFALYPISLLRVSGKIEIYERALNVGSTFFSATLNAQQ